MTKQKRITPQQYAAAIKKVLYNNHRLTNSYFKTINNHKISEEEKDVIIEQVVAKMKKARDEYELSEIAFFGTKKLNIVW